ncbi:MAG: SGNH/GDSL hydrolase family protein [Gammaproteobacteria bacterium]
MKETGIGFIVLLLCIGCLTPSAALAVNDGDINMDGRVSLVDLLWGTQALLGQRVLTPIQEQHGDVAPLVTGIPLPDGNFNLGDVLVISRLAMGLLSFPAPPANLFNIGDSIGEGEAANGVIGQVYHEQVWSTGYSGNDNVNTFNERYESIAPVDYYENNASRDALFNHAISGSDMADFAGQAQNIIASVTQTPTGDAGRVAVLLGNNDVCASSMAAMTDPALFESRYRAGLDVLAASPVTQHAQIHVSGIPAIYWLWNAKRNNFWCKVFAWPFVPCQNLLDNPDDDCASSTSRNDPDNDYPGDGGNCLRRKQFHRIIRDAYNPILRNVLDEYVQAGNLPNATFIDIYDIKFDSQHVNSGDCFHPSTDGHALLATAEWCRTALGSLDPQCQN